MHITAFTAVCLWKKVALSTPTFPPSLFFPMKNLGHMPQRNAKCFNSFAPFLSGCHLWGFSLCPEVICSGWTIKAIMVAACCSIIRWDDWQQRGGAGVEGHWASIYLIWKYFIHEEPLVYKKKNGLIISLRFLWTNNIYSILWYKTFQLPPHLLECLLAVVWWFRGWIQAM